MKARRQLNAVAAATVLAAGGLFGVAGRPWLTLRAQRPAPFSEVVRQVPGRTEFPVLSGLVAVALLAAVLALVTGRWARRGLGVLLAGVGLLVLNYAITGLRHPSTGRVAELLSGGRAGGAGVSGHSAVSVQRHLVWPIFTAPIAVCFLLAGLVMVTCAASWTAGLSARYDPPTRQPSVDDPWRALDRGVDPTITDR